MKLFFSSQSPTNPFLRCVDIKLVSELCHSKGALVSLILAGCASGSEKLVAIVRTLHNMMGGALNTNAAYLLICGLKTLHLRNRQQNSTALSMARLLEVHPKVNHVYYPGLVSRPEHKLAKRQMTGFGGVVSFEIDGYLMTAANFIDAL